MMHRRLKDIGDKISELKLFDTKYWDHGACLYIYGKKRPDERRHKHEIMMISSDGLRLYTFYSWDVIEFEPALGHNQRLQISGIDVI